VDRRSFGEAETPVNQYGRDGGKPFAGGGKLFAGGGKLFAGGGKLFADGEKPPVRGEKRRGTVPPPGTGYAAPFGKGGTLYTAYPVKIKGKTTLYTGGGGGVICVTTRHNRK
jgi:hypothetical protein